MTPHRSRTFWPAPLGPRKLKPAATEHEHQQPRLLLVPLYVGVLVLTVAVALLAFYVVRFNDYVDGRGEYRDRETARLRAEISASWCKALDALPAGGLLDELRDQHGCGPGRPLSDFPADVQSRYTPPPPRPVEPELLPPVKPAPPPPGQRGAPLGPVTDAVCERIDICPGETP